MPVPQQDGMGEVPVLVQAPVVVEQQTSAETVLRLATAYWLPVAEAVVLRAPEVPAVV